MNAIDCIQVLLIGYALGSIPFGVVFARAFRLPDPRSIGSGNIGATNMMRTGRKDVALLTLLADMGKGAAAVLICEQLYDIPYAGLALAALCAAVGHMYSVWLSFKGGKGVATILGSALALYWPVGMGAMVIWILVCFTTRFVSVSSILALASIPLIAWLRIDWPSAMILAFASAIGVWRHRDNINRLRNGSEPRLNFTKKATV